VQFGGRVSESVLPKLGFPMVAAHELDAAVGALNEFLKPLDTSLQFAIDRDSRKVVVKLVDLETGTVIRQYSSVALLALAKAKDLETGSLLEALA
jgi:flagellar protein FlaG